MQISGERKEAQPERRGSLKDDLTLLTLSTTSSSTKLKDKDNGSKEESKEESMYQNLAELGKLALFLLTLLSIPGPLVLRSFSLAFHFAGSSYWKLHPVMRMRLMEQGESPLATPYESPRESVPKMKRFASYQHNFFDKFEDFPPIEEHGMIGNMHTAALYVRSISDFNPVVLLTKPFLLLFSESQQTLPLTGCAILISILLRCLQSYWIKKRVDFLPFVPVQLVVSVCLSVRRPLSVSQSIFLIVRRSKVNYSQAALSPGHQCADQSFHDG
jgi:hypothetical protein